MARASLLAVNLAVLALGLSPWLFHPSNERQPIPDSFPIASPASRFPTTSAVTSVADRLRPVTQEAPYAASYCLACHGKRSLRTRFSDGRRLSLYVNARGLRDSAHGLLTCLTCHDNHQVCPPAPGERLDFAAYQAEAAEICVRCHLAAAGDYAGSVHGQPILSGSGEGATCYDCHSLERSGHTVARLSDPRLRLAPQSVDESCGRCHEQELNTYRQTSHSKVARFGDPRRPATCTTCHGDHAVKAVDDPKEPLTAASLVTVCERCHRGADEAFAGGWLGHEAPSARSAAVYYAERSVVLLMAASLGFGLVHMALDFLRRLADRRRGGAGSRR